MAPIAFVIAGQGSVPARVLLWGGILLGVVFIFVAVIYVLRWKMLSKNDKSEPGFTMELIDRLHDEGALADEEYRLARRSVLGLTDPDTPEK